MLKATANAKESLEWGTKIVGGVKPGVDCEHLGLPIFPSVRIVGALGHWLYLMVVIDIPDSLGPRECKARCLCNLCARKPDSQGY